MPRVEITFDLKRAQRVIDDAQREVDLYAPDVDTDEFQALITVAQSLLLAVDGLLDERAKATERERIATTAYDQQQSSYRELEVLYQAMTERAQAAEDRIRRAAEHLPGRPDVAERILSEIRHAKSDTVEG